MAFCSKCGAQMNDGSAFCPSCGAATQAQQQQQYQQPQYQQPQYQQPQYQQPQYQPQYQQPGTQPANGMAAASLVCGILSIFLVPLVFGILGLALGGAAKSKGNRGGMATGGIVCGIIGIVGWIIMLIAFESTVGMFF